MGPICRLLGVSLEELLGFRAELTEQEVRKLVEELNRLLAAEGFGAAYEWARRQRAEYPGCEPLLHSLALILDANRFRQEGELTVEQEAFILDCYRQLLASDDEATRTLAADGLYGYYLRRQEYDKAGECLEYFSPQNPERKRRQAELYEAAGETERAYQVYEELLFGGYQLLNIVLNSLFVGALKAGDLAAARYYGEKRKGLARLFEMGEYNVFAAELELVQAERDVEGTLRCARGLLGSIGTLRDFTESSLYAHMSFRVVEEGFVERLRGELVRAFQNGEEFGYMGSDKRWLELLGEN